MHSPDPTSTQEQLRLFDVPAATRRGHRTVRRRRRPARIVITVLALGIATAGMLAGSYAAWTAQTTNPSNMVTAGTLALTNSKSAASIFSATNVKPGDTDSSTVVLTNAGSVPLGVRLTQTNVTSTGIEASLGLKVHDTTRNWCYWPVSQAGACPATFGAWTATTLSSLAIPATDGSAKWPAGQTHTFTISWQLATTSPNSDQGKAGSFRFVWDGIQ